jgi:hypothetical protein
MTRFLHVIVWFSIGALGYIVGYADGYRDSLAGRVALWSWELVGR